MRIEYQVSENVTSFAPQTAGSAGLDLCSCTKEVLIPRKPTIIGTGVKIFISDPSVAGLLMIRSGLSMQGVSLANGAGLIDSDFQGEIGIVLINHFENPILVEANMRIAQLVFINIVAPHTVDFVPVKQFTDTTQRGEGGFGSTGTSSTQPVQTQMVL